MLHFFDAEHVNWDQFLEQKNIANYLSEVKKSNIMCEGQLTKLERAGDALKYLKICIPSGDTTRHKSGESFSWMKGWLAQGE